MSQKPSTGAHKTNEDYTTIEGEISLYDRLHLRMISIMHDSSYKLFVDPYKLLKVAGLREGQTVLEVGCGPGFFTIPAATIIGKEGHLYSIDINPAAIQHVKQRIQATGLQNVDVFKADAARTQLCEASIDVAFLFGILHTLKRLNDVLNEMHRVLKEKGVLAVQRSSLSETGLLKQITEKGLFRFIRKERRIYQFVRESSVQA